MADIDLGPLAQRLTFCQEQEQDSVNVASSTPVQTPGTLFHPTFTTLLIGLYEYSVTNYVYIVHSLYIQRTTQ